MLTRRLRRWGSAGWAAQAGRVGSAGTRADAVHRSVQRLADLAAAAEGRSRRPVPRLDDRVLPDQLTVMAHDAATAGDLATIHTALAELTSLRQTLGFR